MNTIPKSQYGKIQLGNQQVENLQREVINECMSGNAGLAISKMRMKGFEPTNELYALNDVLVQIELKARREMKKRLIDFFESVKNNLPVS